MTQDKVERIAGWFIEPFSRRKWFVVFRANGDAVCNSDDNYFTAADRRTFRAWGWKRAQQEQTP